MLDPDVLAYYERGEEADRLTIGAGRLEWLRTWELLTRFLPASPAVVYDVGGGPGGYAVPLALDGHRVHLVDAVPLHVDQAREAATRACVELDTLVGDARSLPYRAGSADAVLLFGPLYHLLERSERAAALAEARRVLRPGGVLLAVCITRFAPLWDMLHRGLPVERLGILDETLETGRHRNPERLPRRFTTAHFARPEEHGAEVAAAGFARVSLLAIEGPGGWMRDADDWLDDPERRDWLLRGIRRAESEPSMLGSGPHVMAVGYAL